jgi:hypothetical protein
MIGLIAARTPSQSRALDPLVRPFKTRWIVMMSASRNSSFSKPVSPPQLQRSLLLIVCAQGLVYHGSSGCSRPAPGAWNRDILWTAWHYEFVETERRPCELFPRLIQGASAIRRSGFPTCRLHSCAGSQRSPLQAFCNEPKPATSFRAARDQSYGKCCLDQRSAHIAEAALQGRIDGIADRDAKKGPPGNFGSTLRVRVGPHFQAALAAKGVG